MNQISAIFFNFLKLGLYSFGGPAAHIGYFRQAFVIDKEWVSEEQYGQFVALSQFLPGPGSSQVGFSIGYHRAGLMGAIAAFVGFTVPSVCLMLLFAYAANTFTGYSTIDNIIAGLKLFAVVVVADAAFGMFKTFCQEKITVSITVFTAIVLLVSNSLVGQIVALFISLFVGVATLTKAPKIKPSIGKGANETDNKNFLYNLSYLCLKPLLLFLFIVFSLPFLSGFSAETKLFADFFQAGSLVFGGGHVVLPLLDNLLGNSISKDSFLSGYALAQAVPGPMFTLATFLGVELTPSSPLLGALLATIAVFLPGFILILVVLKNWQQLSEIPRVNGALRGINAAVVGLLIAALYQPVFVSAVISVHEFALVVFGFYLLKTVKLPLIAIMTLFCIVSAALL
jgi:chromate transporter